MRLPKSIVGLGQTRGFGSILPPMLGDRSTFAVADGAGELTYAVDNTHPVHAPQLQAGSTWNFQAWYRDPAAGGANFDLSGGYSVSFLP